MRSIDNANILSSVCLDDKTPLGRKISYFVEAPQI